MSIFRLLLVVLLAVFPGACSAQPALPQVIASTIAGLDPGHPERTRFGSLEFRGGLRLSAADQAFGGWSGARLDGSVLTAIGDLGSWLRLALRHDGGRLVGVHREAGGSLRRLDGDPAGNHKRWADAEGLAHWRDGWVVSFERHHRLWFYAPDLADIPVRLAAPPDMARLEENGGVEAIAALADGRLLMLAEEGGLGWIGTPGAWQPVTWTVTDDFKPTDAVQLPSGALVVLERSFSVMAGVGARLSLVPPGQLMPGARLEGRELLRLEPPMTVDNFEGLAVGRGPDGETMLYLLSDDNFSALQATLLLAFALAGD